MMRRRPRGANGKPTPPTPTEASLFRWRPARLRGFLPPPLLAALLAALLVLLVLPRHLHRRPLPPRPPTRLCTGTPYPLSAHRDRPGRARVQIGDCRLQFIRDVVCAPSVPHGLATLPCANASLRLTSAHSGRVLRAFGVRSRAAASLPQTVAGAVVPLRAAPVGLLDSLASRAAAWRPAGALPPADACGRGRCRRLVRAMLAAYLAGCGPLAEGAVWETPEAAKGDAAEVVGPLIAFPRACGREAKRDRVAEDILLRYLSVTCEAPASLRAALRRMRRGRFSERARFVAGAIGGEGVLWRRVAGTVCKGNVRFYEYDPWRDDVGVMTQMEEMRKMSTEG